MRLRDVFIMIKDLKTVIPALPLEKEHVFEVTVSLCSIVIKCQCIIILITYQLKMNYVKVDEFDCFFP